MLWITEKFLNADTCRVYHTTDWHETRFDRSELRALMKSLVKEYGWVSSVWREPPGGGERRQVGWRFQRRTEKEGAPPGTRRKDLTFLREVYVEVSLGNPKALEMPVSPWAEVF